MAPEGARGAGGGGHAEGREHVGDLMPLYYGRLFPFAPVARWLAHGNDGKHAQADRSFLKRREFCFTLPGDIFVRCVRGRPGLPAPEPPAPGETER